jgi:outer membrane receptor protein involved in Fe transport
MAVCKRSLLRALTVTTACSLGIVLFAVASAAGAQTLAAPADVVVTAQKREQSLQLVPLDVIALSASRMAQAGVTDIKSLQILTPGLTVTSSTSEASTTARIRGIGTVGDNPGLESSVGVVIDGVYRARNGVGFEDLGELDRIEVLKGPQGTLFGKSTSAGVINVLTAQPSFKAGYSAEATAGNYDGWGVKGSVTGPLIADQLAGRLYVGGQGHEGYNTVVTGAGPRGDERDDDQNAWTVRGQLLYTPNTDVRVRLIADVTDQRQHCCEAVQVWEGSSPVSRAALLTQIQPSAETLSPSPDSRVTYANQDDLNHTVDGGLSAQVDAKLGFADFTSISAWRDWRSQRGTDWDFSAADLLYNPDGQATDRFDTFSEEARLAGKVGRVTWLGGVFLASETYNGAAPKIYGSDYYAFLAGKVTQGAPGLIGLLPSNTFLPGAGQRDRFRQTDDTIALFTNDTFALTDAWDVTAGVRYTDDEKRLNSTFATTSGSCSQGLAAYPALASVVGGPTAGAITGALCLPWETQAFDATSGLQTSSEKGWSGTAGTNYRWTPDLMSYASYSRGYKAGGFNFDRAATSLSFTPTSATLNIAHSTYFAPETVDAYEVGIKSQWLDRTVTLNAALFDQTYHDFQLNAFLGTSFVVESIPQVNSAGLDVDMGWATPVKGLRLDGGATYAQTHYGQFTASQLTYPQDFAGFSRLPGATVSYAPLWSATLAGDYQRPLGEALVGRFNLAAKYSSTYNTGSDLAPQKVQGAYTVFNARLGVGNPQRGWTIEAWAENLTNVTIVQLAINAPLQGTETDPASIRTYDAFLAPPRTFGLTLRFKG